MSIEKTRHTGGINPPGYVCPKRRGRKLLAIHVTSELASQVRDALEFDNSTLQEKGEELIQGYVRSYEQRSHNQLVVNPVDERRTAGELLEEAISRREVALTQAATFVEIRRINRDLAVLREQLAHVTKQASSSEGSEEPVAVGS